MIEPMPDYPDDVVELETDYSPLKSCFLQMMKFSDPQIKINGEHYFGYCYDSGGDGGAVKFLLKKAHSKGE